MWFFALISYFRRQFVPKCISVIMSRKAFRKTHQKSGSSEHWLSQQRATTYKHRVKRSLKVRNNEPHHRVKWFKTRNLSGWRLQSSTSVILRYFCHQTNGCAVGVCRDVFDACEASTRAKNVAVEVLLSRWVTAHNCVSSNSRCVWLLLYCAMQRFVLQNTLISTV